MLALFTDDERDREITIKRFIGRTGQDRTFTSVLFPFYSALFVRLLRNDNHVAHVVRHVATCTYNISADEQGDQKRDRDREREERYLHACFRFSAITVKEERKRERAGKTEATCSIYSIPLLQGGRARKANLAA
jgi:hypothetical protein